MNNHAPSSDFEGPRGRERVITVDSKPHAQASAAGDIWFRALVERSADAMILLSDDNVVMYASPNIKGLLGYASHMLINQPVQAFVHPDDLPANRERGIAMRAGGLGATTTGEMRGRHRDGTWRWIEVVTTNLLDDPNVRAFVLSFRDVTERKRSEEQQQRQHRYLEALHEVMLGLINRLDVNDLLHAIIARAGELSGTPHGFINLVSGHGDEIEFGIGHGLFNIAGIQPTRRGEGLTGVIWQTKQPLAIADYTKWSNHRAGPHLGLMHAIVGVPLLRGETVIGVLGLAHEEAERTFDDAAIEALSQFARLAALALDNAQLYSAVQTSEQHYRTMIDTAQEGVWLFNAQGIVTFANEKMAHMLGYSLEEMVGTPFSAFMDPPSYEKTAERLMRVTQSDQAIPGQHDCCFLRRDGAMVWTIVAASLIYDDNGSFAGSLCMITDITERKKAEDALRYHATHDALTNLPNRTLFFARLEHAIERRQADPAARFAMLFLDLDRFKHVNDSLGHIQGDQLLLALVDRVKSILPATCLLARWGGDEFAILMEQIASVNDAIQLAEQLHTALVWPFVVGHSNVYVTASIGIAQSTSSYATPDEVLRDADTAMYRAKASGGGHAVFDATMHAAAVARLQLESDLRQAIEREEFVAHYQPIVSLQSGKVTGVEALIRWQHPQRGLISPAEFIPIAEETKLIVALNRWMLRTACRQIQAWGQAFPALASLSVSVNLSARDLAQPDCVADVLAALAETRLDPQRLHLEITESALVEHAEIAALLLHQLQEKGIQIHLDDFGTGYSSLGYLRKFTVDVLKIDNSFLRAEGGEKDIAIVRAIVALAHSLGIRVIAEGIETRQQVAQLRQMACGEGQGYVFARPLNAQSAVHFLTAHAPQPPFAPTHGIDYSV